ncbi:MAG: ferrochelatase [Flexistipes sinusarabici]|uniref:Ferrochelatase n=1 Tax=Flexistipes sinusarabici TaxID=2352 RepID=A0A5D0MQA3_FLESI|nr:ferrochelatase [Flexistipes sinusarabici]TYB33548.1 MAG: ferrochelatase [Flexistipes sinusarabici]
MHDLLFAMYMGGPDSIQSIQPFLYNLFTDRDIINFKIGKIPQQWLAKIISTKRSRKIAPEYEKMGGGSPQLKYMQSLLEKTEFIYNEKYGRSLDTRIGMCYYHPYIEDTLKSIEPEEYDNIYIVSMYPHYSYTTSGACFKRFNTYMNMRPFERFKAITHWHLNESYNNCLLKRIKNAAEKLEVNINDAYILFSAHSLPEYTLREGDYYARHIDEQIKLLTDRLSHSNYSLAYQSRTGPMKWLGPETRDVLKNLVEKGVDNIIVVPVSFVSDHIETLIELDDQYIKEAKKGGANIIRSESLNDSEDFAEAVIDIITDG